MAQRRRLRRGIYLLPTLFTVGNLLCGYSSIVFSARGAVELAAVLIIVAGILDGLDGRIARLTGATSEFGLQFDSLADIVSFGVAPALLAYHWALRPFGRFGWLVPFIFVVCAAMRLARFNMQARDDKRFFAGLPSPAAAGTLASTAFAFPQPAQTGSILLVLAMLVAALALMMVSRFRYRSFKGLDLRDRRSYIWVLPLSAGIVVIAVNPKLAFLLIGGIYLISAPAAYIWSAASRLRQRSGGRADSEVADEPALR